MGNGESSGIVSERGRERRTEREGGGGVRG